MKKNFHFLMIIATVALFSCQKEINGDINTNNGNGGGGTGGGTGSHDTVYLEKHTQVIAGSLIDSIITGFQYDNQRRLISFNQKQYYTNSLEVTVDGKYYYNGTDTLAFKYTSLGNYINYGYTDTVVGFLFYDASGRKILDSSTIATRDLLGYGKVKEIEKRQYAPGFVYYDYVSTDLINPNPSPTYYKDTAWLDANRNVIRSSEYSYQSIYSYIEHTGIYTYDNKPNPYSFMSAFNCSVELPNTKGGIVPQRNNCLTYYVEDYFFGQPPTPPTIYSLSFVHTFNTNGMVTKTVASDGSRDYYSYRAF